MNSGEGWKLKVKENIDRRFAKLAKKDKTQMKAIWKKINQIVADPYHAKPLKAPMQHLWRVQVGSFVLIYAIDDEKKIVTIIEYLHHDKAY